MFLESSSAYKRRMRGRVSGAVYLVLIIGLCQPQAAGPQSRDEPTSDCGAEICLQTGISNWRAEASDYCEADVCLGDSLTNLVSLDWRRMTAGQDSLTAAATNPFVGLTSEEYLRLRELGDADIPERVQLLAKVRVSCQFAELTMRLDVPGRDIVDVTFSTPLVVEGNAQSFRVTKVDRTYRGLPGGSVGWWIRWIGYRFPGIELMEHSTPTTFANYEIGLYMGRLILMDKNFRPGPLADYGRHPDCLAR